MTDPHLTLAFGELAACIKKGGAGVAPPNGGPRAKSLVSRRSFSSDYDRDRRKQYRLPSKWL